MINNRGERRAVPEHYVKGIADAVPPSRWNRIIEGVAAKAEDGDMKSIAFLEKYLIGANPPRLTELAEREIIGIDAMDEIINSADLALAFTMPDPLTKVMFPDSDMSPIESHAHFLLRKKKLRQQRAQASELSAPPVGKTSGSKGSGHNEPSAT